MSRLMKACLTAAALGLAALPGAAQERPSTILVLDASGSMWGQIDGVNKIVIARDVVSEILGDFPDDQNLGLVAYGHRERGECSDIELMVPPAPGTAGEIAGIVATLNPRGMTPMADSVIAAAEALRYTENAATVILVSDGIETCNPDPCAAARALDEAGIDFTAHVIGFDVAGEAEALLQMQCMAEATGGSFHTADNASELRAALQEVVAAPQIVTIGFAARIGDPTLPAPNWYEGAPLADQPFVEGPVLWTLIDDSGARVVDEVEGNPLILDLPAGDYAVSAYYLVGEALAKHEVELVYSHEMALNVEFPGTPEPIVAEGMLHAPVQAVVGSEFPVTWEATDLHPRDYITIVPAGADDGEYGTFDRVAERAEGKLRAPSLPGLYEVRLQTNGEDRVIARTPIEIIDIPVSVSTLDQVVIGSSFRVTWTAEGLHPRDYVTIVPMGADDGASGDFSRIGDKSEGSLRAPGEAGLYEVRLQMDRSDRVLARTPVEVIEVPVTVSAPDQAVVGSTFRVSWEAEGLHPRDYVTIVPMGAEEGDSGNYSRIGEGSEGTLRAPAEAGLYEVRLQMDREGRVLASTPIEIVDVAVTVTAPDQAVVGSTFRVSWAAEGLHPRDYVTIVPVGTEEGEWGDYSRIGEGAEGTLRAPAEAGLYEVRLQMDREGRVLASTPIEIIDVEVTVSAPAQAVLGSAFRVTWEAEGLHPRDYVTIVPMGAEEGASGDYARIGENRQADLRAPVEPGFYEVRLQMDREGRVLASTPIEIIAGDVTVSGPEQVRAGHEMTLSWTGTIHPRDYITIVPAGAPDEAWDEYFRVGDNSQGKMKAPEEPGLYEVRYMLDREMGVMARQVIEVLAADAPMDDGAGLVVPATATPGQTVTVTWSDGLDGADQRVTLARADQADFTWISAESVAGRNSMKLTLPDEPGTYEVRFLDIAAGKVLGRAIITVE